MKPEQQKQAENLYFQTDLSKTEIAQAVGVSRRALHYWVRENHWDIIKMNAAAMPISLAGNCYLILARLQDSILSPERVDKPVTLQEVNTMHKLIVTIGKLRERAALSEVIETMTYFMQYLNDCHPPLAESVKPIVSQFLTYQAAEQSAKCRPFPAAADTSTAHAEEEQLDQEDLVAFAAQARTGEAGAPNPPAEISSVVPQSAGRLQGHIGPAPSQPAPKPPAAAQYSNPPIGNRAARRAAARAATRSAA